MESTTKMMSSSLFEPEGPELRVFPALHNGKCSRHCHDFLEFVYVDRGFTLHRNGAGTTVLTAGDIIAVVPGEYHSYVSAYQTGIYNCIFYPRCLGNLLEELRKLPELASIFDGVSPPAVKVDLSERREVVSILERIMSEREQRELGWEFRIKLLLSDFLIFCARKYAGSGERADITADTYTEYAYKIMMYIEKNYQNDIDTGMIADYLGLSSEYAVKQFKNSLGISPMEYLKKFRVAKSMEQLQSTELTVAEIARNVGYPDVCYFMRVFKQCVGMTPKAYRQQN